MDWILIIIIIKNNNKQTSPSFIKIPDIIFSIWFNFDSSSLIRKIQSVYFGSIFI